MFLKLPSLLRSAIACLSIAVLGTMVPAETHAQTSERCFAETGFCISGNIRAYWEKNGGLPVFGYPISAQQNQTIEGTWTGPTQWFERDRLEDHSNENKGVLAGRLGDEYQQSRGIDWQQVPGDGVRMPNCRFFPETSRNLCGAFLTYWEKNGGLARFGYPITSAYDEALQGKTYTVQYFERRRMEYHPENAGTNYDVLLGLLGRSMYSSPAAQCSVDVPAILSRVVQYYRETLGCPTVVNSRKLASQVFENGTMLWEEGDANTAPKIFVITYDQKTNTPHWLVFEDKWREGDSQGKAAPQPPVDRQIPQRGFGYLWRNNTGVQQMLGFAITAEQGDTGVTIKFQKGEEMLYFPTSTDLYVLKPDGSYEKTNVQYRP